MLDFFFALITWLFFFLGLIDTYIAYRFVRDEPRVIDRTAGFLNWWVVKWFCMTQRERVARCLPFVGRDLGENMDIRPDDGGVT